jgi:5-methylcytosine-specific restriction endonuclease McrA
MSLEKIRDLWGNLTIIENNPCEMPFCNAPKDNAGNGNYHKYCSNHHKRKYGMQGAYKRYRKEYCENIDGRFGFTCTTTILITKVQLHVDHIDGDNTNDEVSNLQTLCADCHAIKTSIHLDNLKHQDRPNKEQISLRWERLHMSLNEKSVNNE